MGIGLSRPTRFVGGYTITLTNSSSLTVSVFTSACGPLGKLGPDETSAFRVRDTAATLIVREIESLTILKTISVSPAIDGIQVELRHSQMCQHSLCAELQSHYQVKQAAVRGRSVLIVQRAVRTRLLQPRTRSAVLIATWYRMRVQHRKRQCVGCDTWIPQGLALSCIDKTLGRSRSREQHFTCRPCATQQLQASLGLATFPGSDMSAVAAIGCAEGFFARCCAEPCGRLLAPLSVTRGVPAPLAAAYVTAVQSRAALVTRSLRQQAPRLSRPQARVGLDILLLARAVTSSHLRVVGSSKRGFAASHLEEGVRTLWAVVHTGVLTALQLGARAWLQRRVRACPVCLETPTFRDTTCIAAGCLDRMCSTCLGAYVDFAVAEGRNKIMCPHADCSEEMRDDDVLRVRPECDVEARRTARQKLHGARLRALLSSTSASDKAYVKWATTFARVCPMCHVLILRDGGCNHMTCTCGQSFDWASNGVRFDPRVYNK